MEHLFGQFIEDTTGTATQCAKAHTCKVPADKHTLFNVVHLPKDEAKSARWLGQNRRGCLQRDALFDELCPQQMSVTCLWTIIQQCTSVHEEHQMLMRDECPLEAAMFENEVTINLSRCISHLYDLRLLAHGTVLFRQYMLRSCFLFLPLPVHSPFLLSTEHEGTTSQRSDDIPPLQSESNTAIFQLFSVARVPPIPSLSYIKLKHYTCPLHTTPHTTVSFSDMC